LATALGDQRWVVADLSVGTAFNYKNTKLTYALVYRTKEFEGRKKGRSSAPSQ
jgi:hypothetical protein